MLPPPLSTKLPISNLSSIKLILQTAATGLQM
jgi:hypothetical protein